MLEEIVIGEFIKAVFNSVFEAMNFDQKIRGVLGMDPVKLAFKNSLTRTYTTFMRHYPELVPCYEHSFLSGESAVEVSKLLYRDPLNPIPKPYSECGRKTAGK